MNLVIEKFRATEGMDCLFDGIVDDSVTKEEYIRKLETMYTLSIYNNNEYCGCVSLELVDPNYCEAHILLFPSKRKLSVRVMREVIDLIQKAGKVPMTSVSGDYPHIKRCLEILGLRVFKVEENSIIKNGVPYHRYFMEYNKE